MGRKLVFVIQIALLSVRMMAQTQQRWSLAPSVGTILVHSDNVENTRGARPRGIQIDYAWQRTDSLAYRKFFGLPTQGVSFIAYNFDNNVLGKGYNLIYFIEPEIRFSARTGLSFRAATGASYLTNPHRPASNPANNSYSTHLIGYLGMSVQPYVQISKSIEISLGVSYRHVSNGGIKLPNKGVNWVTAELSVYYFVGSKVNIQPILNRYKLEAWKKENRFDVYVFGSLRSIITETDKKYGVYGLGITHAFQTGKTHALTVGAEVYNDISAAIKMHQDGLNDQNMLRSGVLLGHEFLWGKFRFTQQVGLYLYDQTPYYPGWYHRWGILYALNKHLSTGVVVKVHRHVAAFPDIRMVYSLKK